MPDTPCTTTDECPHAAAAAEKAVKKTFAILGVDIDQPREVKDFQESLRFGERLRRISDRSQLVFWGAITVSLLAALWAGIIEKLK